jgi:hypothetical protein
MQATVRAKRVNLGRVKTAVLGIGIVGSLAIGVALLASTRDDAAPAAPADTHSITWIHSDEAWALEQELMLQNDFYGLGGATDSGPAGDELPEEAIDARLAAEWPKAYFVAGQGEGLVGGEIYDDIRFLEMNLDLPGAASTAAPNWRVIEENNWGADFVFEGTDGGSVAPSAEDVPQSRAGEVRY